MGHLSLLTGALSRWINYGPSSAATESLSVGIVALNSFQPGLRPMKTWTIRQRILGSFAAVLALMIVMGGVAYTRLQLVEQDATTIQKDSLPGVAHSSQLMSAWLANYALTQEHILQTDAASMRKVESQLQANRSRLEDLSKSYEMTVFVAKDRANFEAFKGLRGPYVRAQEELLKLSSDNQNTEARALLNSQLEPAFEKIQTALQVIVDFNTANGDEAGHQIMTAVATAKAAIISSLAVACLLAFASGYFLFRSITQPMGRLINVTDAISKGDFTQRMTPGRQDEFGTLAHGFNRMIDELTLLVGQVQKSGIQVNTSATEIAATAKEQQATASEIAATTSEVGATSKEI
ncbi:MAG: methyl-accepting chemotaxis protein, partial [Burkholderiales bacterium]